MKIFRVLIECNVEAENAAALQERIDTETPGEILEKSYDISVRIDKPAQPPEVKVMHYLDMDTQPPPRPAVKMHTVITTNNGYDSILLVDTNDRVLSAWTAEKATINDYLRDGSSADNWETGSWPQGFDPDDADNAEISDELRTIAAYGQECGRNGVIEDDSRREFWNRFRHTE